MAFFRIQLDGSAHLFIENSNGEVVLRYMCFDKEIWSKVLLDYGTEGAMTAHRQLITIEKNLKQHLCAKLVEVKE